MRQYYRGKYVTLDALKSEQRSITHIAQKGSVMNQMSAAFIFARRR